MKPLSLSKYLLTFKIVGYIIITIYMISFSAYADTNLNYTQARIKKVNQKLLQTLSQKGIAIDRVRGDTAIIYIRTDQLSILKDMNIAYEFRSSVQNVEGYHSIESLADHLKTIEKKYPDICKRYSIGKSYEGRDLWFMKISDNVNEEEDEPEFKYISTMHGDEPVGMELCLRLIDYLTLNYGTKASTTALVDDLEIWIMPLMNPDGFVHQQRYNRQGVDLNRDFPDRVTSNLNTTEGRAVETALVMNWAFAHSSVLSANFHTGALVVNYPYDSDFNPYKTYSATPEDELFQELSLSYSSLNPSMYNSSYFDRGITNGVQWYYAYGGMQDWNYIWMGCNELTIELSDIKWPAYSTIDHFWEENRDAMIHYITWALRGIRGIITDIETAQPVDAVVRVIGIDHDIYTDPDVGDYHRILLPGTYDIEFSSEGYVTKRMNDIVVNDHHATRLDIQLMRESYYTNIQNPIIMLQAISGINIENSLIKFDRTGNGKIGLPEVIYTMQMIAGMVTIQ